MGNCAAMRLPTTTPVVGGGPKFSDAMSSCHCCCEAVERTRELTEHPHYPLWFSMVSGLRPCRPDRFVSHCASVPSSTV